MLEVLSLSPAPWQLMKHYTQLTFRNSLLTIGQGGAELPAPAVLESLVSTCYQASLLRQETIPVIFRLIVIEPESLPTDGGPPSGLHRLEFARHLEFNALELRRLSSAAHFSRTLIGVRIDPNNGPEIWGLVHSGPRWLHAIHGGRGSAPPLPDALTISVTGPGELDVGKGREVIGHLAEGRVFERHSICFNQSGCKSGSLPFGKSG
jgi:hypothetical protein